jgi:hypothetical protein
MASLPEGSNIPVMYGRSPNKLVSTFTHFFRIGEGLAEDMFKGKL